MEKITIDDFGGLLYSIRCTDYKEGVWTVPVKCTRERIMKLLDDRSVTDFKLSLSDDIIMEIKL